MAAKSAKNERSAVSRKSERIARTGSTMNAWINGNRSGSTPEPAGSALRTELRVELRFTGREEHNLQSALLSFRQRWAVNLLLVAVAASVLHLQQTLSAQLDAIVHARPRPKAICAKTGAGIIHLQQADF